MKYRLFRPLDLLVIIFLVVTIFAFSGKSPGLAQNIAEIYHDGMLYRTLDLTKEATYNVLDHMVVEVSEGSVRVIESDCPEKLCVKSGWISHPDIPIVCLPNKITIIIPSNGKKGDTEMDAITR
ncbi:MULTISPECIES: NusG domain II-containing protein [Kosmotoga]|jgi:hypothetical protein|uniref:Uncharacterized protein n=1 Tax=Kosmotoga olearia (strain ATCC BAA-1733 / DSM 21960 / TBF 19.5.1) TaxID=521045 RepID=C5CFH2_KOSOT|nr:MULTISPECIES: NusG domain II-containing protein [Kosmotoga]ACR80380.1 protein of unknown function DUF1312 [Kosmotoga olearia TBF 19.5.1]MDI3524614.1 hypothetical protein [Kosmotoga sp.]MDK2953357.1 hypothetical protein [Kosmotoga sp.]OAA19885.1 hypothetical protein DU53_09280 [Kosmotoga sp. DU53]